MLIVGKQNLLEVVEELLQTNKIKRIFFNGAIDKELISLIKNSTLKMEEKLDFRVVIPHINSNALNIASDFLEYGEIRTNVKCKSKFILVDNKLFYLSGNNKNLPYYIDDKDFIIKLEEDNVMDDLEEIFLKNWNKGMILCI